MAVATQCRVPGIHSISPVFVLDRVADNEDSAPWRVHRASNARLKAIILSILGLSETVLVERTKLTDDGLAREAATFYLR